MERLRTAKLCAQPEVRREPRGFFERFGWVAGLRWAMVAPVVIAVICCSIWVKSRVDAGAAKLVPADSLAVKPDIVRVNHALVSSFDAVAELPGGEPVRFRCQKWMDGIEMKDASRGLVIEQNTPRVEVIPVRFETY